MKLMVFVNRLRRISHHFPWTTPDAVAILIPNPSQNWLDTFRSSQSNRWIPNGSHRKSSNWLFSDGFGSRCESISMRFGVGKSRNKFYKWIYFVIFFSIRNRILMHSARLFRVLFVISATISRMSAEHMTLPQSSPWSKPNLAQTRQIP